jgi:general secretion pathway protein G
MQYTGDRNRGFTLTELMAVLAVLGLIAAIVMAKATGGSAAAKSGACQAFKGDIEVQCEVWMHNTGSWPATNLSNIGGDVNYFPAGLPTCPVDGSAYTINTSGRVVGHNH